MPHKIAFDESVDCFFVERVGPVEADEWQAWFEEMAGLPWFRLRLNGFQDLRQAQIRLGRSKSRIPNASRVKPASRLTYQPRACRKWWCASSKRAPIYAGHMVARASGQ